MRYTTLIGLVAALVGRSVQETCSAALTIDDFAGWSSHTNALGSWVSDDGTMSSIMASAGTLSFKPKHGSLFYETFSCQAFGSKGYSSVQFIVKGPAGGSFNLKLKTKSSCSSSSVEGYSYTVSGLTGSKQTITISLSDFAGANTDAIVGLCFEDFSTTASAWELCDVQFGCDGNGGGYASATSSSESAVYGASSSSDIYGSTATEHTYGSSTTKSDFTEPPGTTSSSSTNPTPSSTSSTTLDTTPPPTPSSTLSSTSTTSFTSSTSFSSSTSTCSDPPCTRVTTWTPPPWATPTGACTPLVIEDWSNRTRIIQQEGGPPGTYTRGQNLLLEPYNSNNITHTINEASNRVFMEIDAIGNGGEWFTHFGCFNATERYEGFQIRMAVPAGTMFDVGAYSRCLGPGGGWELQAPWDFGWVFDGTERDYRVPFQSIHERYPSARIFEFLSRFTFMVIRSMAGAPELNMTLGRVELYCPVGPTPPAFTGK